MINVTGHAETGLDRELTRLMALMTGMGNTVAEMLSAWQNTLGNDVSETPLLLKEQDKKVNEAEEAIETCVMEILSLHHPMMDELRLVAFSPKIALLYERMGDIVKKNARRFTKLGEEAANFAAPLMKEMAAGDAEYLKQSMALLHKADKEVLTQLLRQEGSPAAKTFKKELKSRMETSPLPLPDYNRLQLIGRDSGRISAHVRDTLRIMYFVATSERIGKRAA